MSMLDGFPLKDVVVISKFGSDDEQRLTVRAHIQAKEGYFEVSTPIYEGDIVEFDDPRGGTERRLVGEVNVNDYGSPAMHHTAVTFRKAPPVRTPPVRRIDLQNLHPEVVSTASSYFADGHHWTAVAEAFKSIDLRVKQMSGIELSGVQLMGQAFNPNAPVIEVAQSPGRSGQDEREGFLALFRGAMLAVRNPAAHEKHEPVDPQEALEYLAFASLLHRRLDAATN